MYRSILVPLDGSQLSERSLPLAQALARRAGAALHLAHVHIPSSAPLYTADLPLADTQLDERTRESELSYLKASAQRLRTESDFPVDIALLDGAITDSVAELIAAHVCKQSIDLVVMTTHGRGGFARFWLGSVADELVRQLPVPVLLLRPDAHAPSTAVARTPRRMLIPLDGSANAEVIVPHVLALGQAAQAEYTLLRVVESVAIAHPFPVAPAVRELDDQLIDQLRIDAQIYLEQVAERLAAQGLATRIEVVVAPQPASAILEQAQQDRSDLIAMATHGRRGLARVLLGSVADNVLRGATIPVLLYRAPRQKEDQHG
jgi:nucleotide-binding universal stress UspA family protein